MSKRIKIPGSKPVTLYPSSGKFIPVPGDEPVSVIIGGGPAGDGMLFESGDFMLMEDGNYMVYE